MEILAMLLTLPIALVGMSLGAGHDDDPAPQEEDEAEGDLLDM